jgi:hypothetical protein
MNEKHRAAEHNARDGTFYDPWGLNSAILNCTVPFHELPLGRPLNTSVVPRVFPALDEDSDMAWPSRSGTGQSFLQHGGDAIGGSGDDFGEKRRPGRQ